MPTIKDVARKAQVSISTVSRVLNNKDRVKDETRERVLSVIEEMSFVTNFSAKTLRGSKTCTIGVIVPDISVSFYSEIIKGIENKSNEYDYKLVVCNSQYDIEKQNSFLRFLYDGSIDGVILVLPRLDREELNKLTRNSFAVAVLGYNTEEYGIPSITWDNKAGAYNAVKHLCSHGYSKIAYIANQTGEYGYDNTFEHHDQERLEGYVKALKDNNIEVKKEYIEGGQYCEEGASRALLKLLSLEVPPDAVFCANDEMALGVLKTARKNNIRIPQDLGLIGFDNIRICQYTSPSITTVDVQTYNLGVLICERLLQNINYKDSLIKVSNLALKPELVIRESCGC